ncbi:MAG: type II toxin-antitoxin system VapC family toxin [Burkholderiales bacterium]|nr:type II toxin-antitoxin system VapC family toxin [Burkholderiales bacterium]
MRALDTNVLVRALVQDDAAQGRRAQTCLSAQPVYIPVTVILELEWVLRSRYRYSPKAIAAAMEKLAILENAVVGEQAAVVAAATKLRHGWDFADALHHALAAGCDDFATFDTTLSRRARRDDSTAPPVIAI